MTDKVTVRATVQLDDGRFIYLRHTLIKSTPGLTEGNWEYICYELGQELKRKLEASNE